MNESIMILELKLPLLSGIDVKLTDDSTETQHSACNFFSHLRPDLSRAKYLQVSPVLRAGLRLFHS